MERNPAPDCRCPADWVIAEATALRMLTRFYGWVVVEPGHLRRYQSEPDQLEARAQVVDLEVVTVADGVVATTATAAAVS
jgi:hypothetical protein